MYCFFYLLYCFFFLFSVIFFTLFERRLISFFMLRIGPSNLIFYGLLQSLADFFRLIFKFFFFLSFVGSYWCFSVFIGVLVLFFVIYYFFFGWFFFCFDDMGFFFFYVYYSFVVYAFIFMSWSSGSLYSLLSLSRLIVQVVSYEVGFFIVFFFFFFVLWVL